jgi:hypothetical protein
MRERVEAMQRGPRKSDARVDEARAGVVRRVTMVLMVVVGVIVIGSSLRKRDCEQVKSLDPVEHSSSKRISERSRGFD